jgi:acetolactate synthase-1/2/3 large subunit
MNNAEFLVRHLKARGVERVFVLCGNGLKPFLDACVACGMPMIDVRNEQGAAYMADLWGRATGSLGVVAVSAGPGHTNALTGLANSWWDGGPMLLISGCSTAATRGRGHFQELEQVAMAAPVCKYARFVARPETLPHELEQAIGAALAGRPGPAHLTVPLDVWTAPAADTTRALPNTPARVVSRAVPDRDGVRAAVEALADARAPVLIAGSGAFYAGAGEALHDFAALTDIPVFSQMWDRGCIRDRWPQYVGVTSGEVNGAYAMLARADVVLTLGARVDYRLGYGRPPVFDAGARFFRVDVDPSELSRTVTPEAAILADPRSALEALAAEWAQKVDRPPHTAWCDQLRQARAAFLARWEERGREEVCPVPSLRLCRELKPFLDQEVTFLLDGGNIGRWAHMLLWDRHPAHWHTCGTSGVIGWGLPGAVAARLARPSHPVLLLSGDGSAGFTLAEIETALRFGTPYVAVIAADDAWGIEADSRPSDRRQATTLGPIRFDRVAEALGARGVFIETPSQIGPAVARGLAENRVTVVHVPTQLAGISAYEEGRIG